MGDKFYTHRIEKLKEFTLKFESGLIPFLKASIRSNKTQVLSTNARFVWPLQPSCLKELTMHNLHAFALVVSE